jgi:N-alpha-acetyltransferase 15/16, NatA auxiliary subunit
LASDKLTNAEKYLLALKCLLAASDIDSSNSTVREQIFRFSKALDEKSASLPAQVLEAIKEEAKKLPSA